MAGKEKGRSSSLPLVSTRSSAPAQAARWEAAFSGFPGGDRGRRPQPYGVASQATLEAIRLLARTEGLTADPVYEGRTIRGLMDLITGGALRPGERGLVLHLGGTPAVHGYANQLSQDGLVPLPFATTATHR